MLERMMTRSVFIWMMLTGLLSCKQSAPLTDKANKALIDSVRQILFNYYDDIKENGMMAEFKYLDSSPEFFWVPPGYSYAISYDSVAAILKQNAPLYKSIENVWDTLRVQPLTSDFVSYTGRLHSTLVDTTEKSIKLFLVETGLMVRRKDGWKLLSGQTSVVPE